MFTRKHMLGIENSDVQVISNTLRSRGAGKTSPTCVGMKCWTATRTSCRGKGCSTLTGKRRSTDHNAELIAESLWPRCSERYADDYPNSSPTRLAISSASMPPPSSSRVMIRVPLVPPPSVCGRMPPARYAASLRSQRTL